MPSPVVAGYFSYPKLPPLIAGEYTCSHGVSPGTIVLRVHPSDTAPSPFGTVVIGDGRKALKLLACKLVRFTAERSDDGNEWLMELEDARWQWRHGRIEGMYNQLDPHGKLIARMIKSPTELANLCLDKMGVSRRFVDMPDGIAGRFVNNIPDFLPVGVNFPQIGINPPVNWYAENPAAVLSQLAELTGRRVVYDPIEDRVLVVRPGIGVDLPDGHIHNVTPSALAPETPDAVEVVGDPTRYETMFELQAVGLEWDGSIRPIDQLSYTPVIKESRPQIVVYTITGVVVGHAYGVAIEPPGETTAYPNVYRAVGGDTVNSIAAAVANLINTKFRTLFNVCRAVASGGTVTITGVDAKTKFDAILFDPKGNESLIVTQAAGELNRRTWDFSPAPSYSNVQATDRLTRIQALQLAQRSVWRMYRLTGRDAATLKAPIQIPGYGPAVRQDVVLIDELCDQVVPDPGDKRFNDKDGKPLIRNLYDGYSRSKPAEVYGSVCSSCVNNGEVWFIGDGAANAGAAGIGGAAVGGAGVAVPRSIAFIVLSVQLGTHYTLVFGDPAAAPVEIDHVAAVSENTTELLAAAIKADIDADPVITKKVTVTVAGAEIIFTAKNPALMFKVYTNMNGVYAAVTMTETGTGKAPEVEADPNGPQISPSAKMTPAGDGKGASINTDPSDRVYVDFSVDPTWQMITFSVPVWFAGPGLTVKEPKLFLRTACNVRNAITQQLAAYSDKKVFRAGPFVHVAKRPDVQLNVIGDYRIQAHKDVDKNGVAQWCWQLRNTRLLEADAVLRARYYLIAELLQFQVKGGLTIEYNGIEPIRLDGKTQQVTYKVVGGVGTMTTASTNMEHSTWVPQYPARRRAENLAAVLRNGAGGNRVDNPAGGGRTPQPPGTT